MDHAIRLEDVVGRDLGRHALLVLRLQQHVNRAGRQLAERRVGGREDRKRPGALERLDQAGRLDGGDERGVIPDRKAEDPVPASLIRVLRPDAQAGLQGQEILPTGAGRSTL
jgi:hypothetical protein